MAQDLYYYESGYIDTSYFVYTADAESAISSQSTMTVAVGVIRDSSASMNSSFEQTVTISHIEGADLFAFSQAAIAIEVSRIRDNNISATAQFSAATDVSRIVHVTADEFSTTSLLTGDNLRVRYLEAATSAAFSLTADIEMVPGGEVLQAQASLSVTASLECQAKVKANIIDCDVTSQFTVNTTGDRIRFLTQELLEVNASATTNASLIASADSSLNSQANSSIDANRLRDVVTALSSQASQTTQLGIVKQFSCSAGALFSPSIDVISVKNTFAVLDSTTSLTVQSTVTKSTSISVSSTTSLTATANKYYEHFYLTAQEDLGSAQQEQHSYYASVKDSQGNVYVAGLGNASATNPYYQAQITKYDQFGNLIWNKVFNTSYNLNFNNLLIDYQDNLVAIGQRASTTAIVLVGFNTSGTITWQREVTTGVGYNVITACIQPNSNTAYVGGIYNVSTGTTGFILQIVTSTGALGFLRQAQSGIVTALHHDGTNLWALVAGSSYAYILNVNTGDGTFNSGRRFVSSGTSPNMLSSSNSAITTDGAGTVFVSHLYRVNSVYYNAIIKLNSDYTNISQNVFSSNPLWSIRNDLVYNSGTLYAVTDDTRLIAIDPSNLTVNWSKTVNFGNLSYTNSIRSDGNYLWIVGSNVYDIVLNSYSGLIMKVNPNGSGIPESGTYQFTDNPTVVTGFTFNYVNQLSGNVNLTKTTATTSVGALDRTNNLTVSTYGILPGGYLQTAQASLASTVSASVIALKNVKISAQLTSSAQLTAQADNAIKTTTAQLQANGFVVTAAGRIRPETADLNSSFALSANAGLNVVAQASVSSQFALTASALDLDLAQAALSSQFSLSADITVNRSSSASLTSSAQTSIQAIKTARITRQLTSNFTLTASVLDLDLAQANLTSSFSLRAQPNRWYPRPNGYWDTNIESQPQWTNWNKLRIHNVPISPSSSPTGFSETLVNLSNQLVITRTYTVGPTRNYLYINGVEYDISGEIGGANPTYYDVNITKGQSSSFGGHVFTAPSFDARKSKETSGPIGTNNFTFTDTYTPPYGGASQTTTLSSINFVNGYNPLTGQTARADIVFETGYPSQSVGESRVRLRRSYSGYSSTYVFLELTVNDTYPTSQHTVTLTRTDTEIILTLDNQSISMPVTTEFEYGNPADWSELNISSGPTGGSYVYYPNNTGFLSVKSSATDVFLTSDTFNESYISSSYPYILSDQTGVLGLYDTYGSLDRTGVVAQLQANLSAQSAQSTQARKTVTLVSAITAQATVVSSLNKIQRTAVTAQASASLTAQADKVRPGNASLTSSAQFTLNPVKTARIQSLPTAQAALTASPYDFTKAQAQLTIQAAITSTALRTKQLGAAITAMGSELVAINKIGQGLIGMDVNANLSIDASVITYTPVFLVSVTNLTATATNVLYAEANLTVTSQFSLQPTYLRRNESYMTSTTTQTTQGQRVRYSSAGLLTSTNLQANDTRTRGLTAAAASTTNIVINNQIVRLAQANLNAVATQVTIAGTVTRFEIHMTALDFVVTAGRIIHIDEYYQLQIENETRGLIITSESRLLGIETETRVNKITGR